MKRILTLLCFALLAVSCGVGSYSVSTGKPDEAYLSFTAAANEAIVVTVDGTEYNIKAVKNKKYKADMKIKKTAANTIIMSPGAHNIIVMKDGRQLVSKKIYVSAQEHKIIEL